MATMTTVSNIVLTLSEDEGRTLYAILGNVKSSTADNPRRAHVHAVYEAFRGGLGPNTLVKELDGYIYLKKAE